MSTHEHSTRANDAQDSFESVSEESINSLSATETYYLVLAERLEKLIFDMQQHGTASNDPLILRLSALLSETHGLLQKANRSDKSL